jgi:hypothetical protein
MSGQSITQPGMNNESYAPLHHIANYITLCTDLVHMVECWKIASGRSWKLRTVTALESMKGFGNNGRELLVVLKEMCYGKAETLGDAGEAVRWWRYNLV